MKFNSFAKKLSVLSVTSLLTLFAGGLNLSAQEIDKELQKEFTIVCGKHNFNLDPHTSSYTTEAQLLVGVYEGLFSYDPITLDPLYAVAKSYRLSRDKKRWTFELRDDAKFSNGQEINAQTVKDSWIMMLAKPNAPYSSLFDIIKGCRDFRYGKASQEEVGIYVIDDKTLTVSLENPASHLPKLLCMPAFSVVSQEPDVYSGAYCITSKSETCIILERNPNYYDLEHTNIEKITFVMTDDPKESSFLYNTGKADWLFGDYDAKSLIKNDDIRISAEFGTQYYFFKIRENSPWNNPELRQALLEACPWAKLRENTYVPASTFVYPLAGYPAVEGYLFTDSKNAVLMANEARKNMGVSEDTRFAIRFAVPDYDYIKQKAQQLKEAWTEIGVDLEIVAIPSWLYLDAVTATDCDLYTYTWIGDFADPLAFLELFRGTSTLNVSGWKNKEYDDLLDMASLYTDENHIKYLAKAEQLLLDQAMVLPIHHPISANVINLETIGGWSVNAFNLHPPKWFFKRESTDKIPNVVIR